MFIDARRVERGADLSADLCIVGAGAAGLTLAQALDNSRFSIILLDSGGVLRDTDAQTLNRGSSNDATYPFQAARARRFGGTTTRWTGVCIPLDESDFTHRDWVPYSGWPLTLADLNPYYERAQAIFGLPSLAAYRPPLHDSPLHTPPIVAKTLLYSDPLDLGRKYRRQIKQSSTVRCIVHGTATRLQTGAESHAVQQIDVATLSGNRFTVRAKAVVLATGGIENARLLLASKIGVQHDVVGRYHMEHPLPVVGVLPVGVHRPIFFTNFSTVAGAKALGTFGLSPALRRREQLLDMHMRAYRYNLFEETPHVVSAKARLRQRDLGALARLTRAEPRDLSTYLLWHGWNKATRTARFDHIRLTAVIEQEPDPDNRITLTGQRDPLGVPLPHLEYHLSDRYHDSIRRTMAQLDTVLQQRGFGRLRYNSAEIGHLAPYDRHGLHHMGSTRMNNDPRYGVVDADCKVHGIANLYIAGSSVFPTGGAANPTLTIAALALRLADHLRRHIAG